MNGTATVATSVNSRGMASAMALLPKPRKVNKQKITIRPKIVHYTLNACLSPFWGPVSCNLDIPTPVQQFGRGNRRVEVSLQSMKW